MANTIAVEEDDWEGWEAEQTPVRCMFVDAIEQSVAAALARDKAATGFDLGAVRHAHKLGIYKTIRLINFVRAKMQENRALVDDKLFATREECLRHMADTQQFTRFLELPFLSDDAYLKPVLADDALLHSFAACDDQDDDQEDQDDTHHGDQGEDEIDDEEDAKPLDEAEIIAEGARTLAHLDELSQRLKDEDGIDIEQLRDESDT